VEEAMLTIKSLGAALLVVLALSAGVFASSFGHTMYLMFNRPVGVPGATLPAGTYIFERVDTASRIDLVQIRDKKRSTVYLTAFTRMVDRPRDLGPTQVVTFREAKPGAAPQIATWFPAGESMGHQFIY
jgi:hypothetical protein